MLRRSVTPISLVANEECTCAGRGAHRRRAKWIGATIAIAALAPQRLKPRHCRGDHKGSKGERQPLLTAAFLRCVDLVCDITDGGSGEQSQQSGVHFIRRAYEDNVRPLGSLVTAQPIRSCAAPLVRRGILANTARRCCWQLACRRCCSQQVLSLAKAAVLPAVHGMMGHRCRSASSLFFAIAAAIVRVKGKRARGEAGGGNRRVGVHMCWNMCCARPRDRFYDLTPHDAEDAAGAMLMFFR